MTRQVTPWAPPGVLRITLILLLFNALNLFDAVATIELIRGQPDIEWNPFMRHALERGEATFLLVKLAASAVFSLTLALLTRWSRRAWYVLIGVTLVYAATFAFHCWLIISHSPL